MKPTEKGEQECLKTAEAHLDEGKKVLENCQKHIMVADWSDYGWATVQQYDINPLATDSEDEKRLEKAEKEAERLASKRRRAGKGAAGKKPRCNWSEGGRRQPAASGGSGPIAMQSQPRPRVSSSVLPGAIWQ